MHSSCEKTDVAEIVGKGGDAELEDTTSIKFCHQ